MWLGIVNIRICLLLLEMIVCFVFGIRVRPLRVVKHISLFLSECLAGPFARCENHRSEINSVSFNPFNEWLLATGATDRLVGLSFEFAFHFASRWFCTICEIFKTDFMSSKNTRKMSSPLFQIEIPFPKTIIGEMESNGRSHFGILQCRSSHSDLGSFKSWSITSNDMKCF